MVEGEKMRGEAEGSGGKKNRKAIGVSSSLRQVILEKDKRNRRKKRYTQRLVGLDSMSDTEYDPTPDMLQKKRKNEKLILELPKLPGGRSTPKKTARAYPRLH